MLSFWQKKGLPPRWSLLQELKNLASLRLSMNISHVLPKRVSIVTATIDDGWGMGLEIIHLACDVLGIEYKFIGLMRKPEEILGHLLKEQPRFLGITLLQEDSIPLLQYIHDSTPEDLLILAGGPAFKNGLKEETMERLRIIANVKEFIEFMIGNSGLW